jgi:hypothetical protein
MCALHTQRGFPRSALQCSYCCLRALYGFQAAGSRHQAAGSRQRAAGSRQQVASCRQQAAGSRQRAASSMQQGFAPTNPWEIPFSPVEAPQRFSQTQWYTCVDVSVYYYSTGIVLCMCERLCRWWFTVGSHKRFRCVCVLTFNSNCITYERAALPLAVYRWFPQTVLMFLWVNIQRQLHYV